MKASSQQGFVNFLLVGIGLVTIGIIAFAGWRILIPQKPTQEKTSQPSIKESLSPDEIEISGSVTFAKQGPTDAVIGEEPTTASLLLGPETAFIKWKKASATTSEILDPDTLATSLSKPAQPSQIKAFTTPKGKYTAILKRNTDIMCLTGPTISYTENNQQYERITPLSCKKFIGLSQNITANIGLIGFGVSSISCSSYNCVESRF